MTLKQILNDSIIINIEIRDSENRMHYEYNHLELAEKCEKIAEDFAIGFAEWHLNLSKSDDWEKFDYNTTEKLLEIYKKEKGL